jgi:hypothetical protein
METHHGKIQRLLVKKSPEKQQPGQEVDLSWRVGEKEIIGTQFCPNNFSQLPGCLPRKLRAPISTKFLFRKKGDISSSKIIQLEANCFISPCVP